MKVKIVNWSEEKYYWYKSRVGEVFEVKEDSSNSSYYNTFTGARILKADTIPVNEIRYEIRDSKKIIKSCITSCEHIRDTSVGSWACDKCEHNCGIDKVNQTVQCSWQEESNKMNLKSIAVRFDNVEQREAIFKRFIDNGFTKSPYENKFVVGEIGYADSLKYVCVLTDEAILDKKIISYEEFMGGKEMKRLDVRKDYMDNKISTSRYVSIVNSKEYTRVQIGEDLHFRLNGDVTLDQANAILKVMGLNYELYEVDWSKVEDGAEVVFWLTCGNLKGQVIGKFNSYIPSLKKIVVICGEKVNVVDEDKVELV